MRNGRERGGAQEKKRAMTVPLKKKGHISSNVQNSTPPKPLSKTFLSILFPFFSAAHFFYFFLQQLDITHKTFWMVFNFFFFFFLSKRREKGKKRKRKILCSVFHYLEAAGQVFRSLFIYIGFDKGQAESKKEKKKIKVSCNESAPTSPTQHWDFLDVNSFFSYYKLSQFCVNCPLPQEFFFFVVAMYLSTSNKCSLWPKKKIQKIQKNATIVYTNVAHYL